jgi:hypothetical protein
MHSVINIIVLLSFVILLVSFGLPVSGFGKDVVSFLFVSVGRLFHKYQRL